MVLVRPQMGENIGAAARAMLNFGLDRMRLVDPRDGWPNPSAVAMASGAGRVLDHAQVFEGTDAAIADLNYVFATTARPRDLTKTVMTPERAMSHARAMMAEGQQVGILFGPERAGLENDDIVRANAIISVPVNPEFPSLNLAQCVLLTGYEWGRQGSDVAGEVDVIARGERATMEDVGRFVAHLQEKLAAKGFFWPEHKAASMRANLENLFRRAPLTETDVRTLHGVIRALAEWRQDRDGPG
ncbi:MAG: RNA methyltransferase, partial [Pseudomonadota bacterium]